MAQLTIQHGPTERTIAVTPDLPLLDQILAQGVDLPYSCRRGDCGLCAVSLTAGNLAPHEPSQAFRRHDDYLLCNCRLAADAPASIARPWFPELAGIAARRSPCKINALRRLGPDVMEVTLRLPPTTPFHYLPGQHIRLTNAQQVTRSYSLAAPPDADRLLRIHVREVEGGAFSDYLFQRAQANDLLQLEGPFGHFFLRQRFAGRHLIFLATGTGIAPVLALLLALKENKTPPPCPIRVYWGNRTAGQAYLHGTLHALQAEMGLDYQALFSRESGGALAPDGPRHVQQLLTEPAALVDAVVYAAGSAAMVEDARAHCLRLGLAADAFIADPFTPS
jgi:CDP-4-dehydro-6-deoxyglucose reductase